MRVRTALARLTGELQSGAKIWDLQLNPPGTKDVNLNVPVIFMNN